jgi:hypothetical protein
MAEIVIQIGPVGGNPPSYPVTLFSNQGKVEANPIPAEEIPEAIHKDFLEGASTETLMGRGRALFAALQKALGAKWEGCLDDLSRYRRSTCQAPMGAYGAR